MADAQGGDGKGGRPRLPYFEWYTGDWFKQTRMLTLAARGALADLLSAMWESQNRGLLTLRPEQYARLLGASAEQAMRVIDELVESGILKCERRNEVVTLWHEDLLARAKELELNRLRVERHRKKKECNEVVMPLLRDIPSSQQSAVNSQNGNVSGEPFPCGAVENSVENPAIATETETARHEQKSEVRSQKSEETQERAGTDAGTNLPGVVQSLAAGLAMGRSSGQPAEKSEQDRDCEQSVHRKPLFKLYDNGILDGLGFWAIAEAVCEEAVGDLFMQRGFKELRAPLEAWRAQAWELLQATMRNSGMDKVKPAYRRRNLLIAKTLECAVMAGKIEAEKATKEA